MIGSVNEQHGSATDLLETSALRPRNFSSVKVSKAEVEGGGWLVV